MFQKGLTDPCFESATPCWTSEDPQINMTGVRLLTTCTFRRECMHCANLRSLGGVLPGDEPEAPSGESQPLTASAFLTQSIFNFCACAYAVAHRENSARQIWRWGHKTLQCVDLFYLHYAPPSEKSGQRENCRHLAIPPKNCWPLEETRRCKETRAKIVGP